MIVVCGEALIDLTAVPMGPETLWRAHCGGGPHNAAVALGRLGIPVGFFGRLSTDGFGRQLRANLAASGVELSRVLVGDEPSPLAVVTIDAAGSPQFTFYGEGTADRMITAVDLPDRLDGVEALHFGTLSLVQEPQAGALSELMARESGRRLLFCDPNVRPSLIGPREPYLERLWHWLAHIDIAKFSDADLAWLLPGADPARVAARLAQQFGVLVVLTRGAEGADAFWAGRHVHAAAEAVQVVDTVGAGDTFGAGFLAELRSQVGLRPAMVAALSPEAVLAALRFGARAAAVTCGRTGADPPWAHEL